VDQLIEEDYLSPFPQIQNTERPDRVMAALHEGRIDILFNGTPSQTTKKIIDDERK
jgi:spore germination protein